MAEVESCGDTLGGNWFILVLVYASSFVIYAVGLPKYSYFFVTVACLVLSALSAVELRRLLKSHVVCRQLKAFAFLFIWGLLLMSFVRHFSGGT